MNSDMVYIALGSQDALKRVMDIYMPIVSRISYRILCDRPESEEVTREVFINVWRNASSFDGRHSISAWLCRITCNLCFRRLRMRHFMEIFSSRQYVYEYSAPLAESPEDDFITKETWAIFCRASQVLTPMQRAVFTLMELEGLSVEDTAAATGLKPNQIKNNLQIARKTIRKELERYGKVR